MPQRTDGNHAAVKPKVLEKHLQAGIVTLLQLDGWRIFQFEQNYSVRKRKVVGEKGMPDILAIRYQPNEQHYSKTDASVLWVECKRPKGQISGHQAYWHGAERARGAVTGIMGRDFTASLDGFLEWYEKAGLQKRRLTNGACVGERE